MIEEGMKLKKLFEPETRLSHRLSSEEDWPLLMGHC
jgi:hypothetical protein